MLKNPKRLVRLIFVYSIPAFCVLVPLLLYALFYLAGVDERNEVIYGDADWSPDGDYVFLDVNSPYYVRDSAYILDVATFEMRDITPPETSVRNGQWSPDGSQIALLVVREDEDDNELNELYAINLDGTSASVLAGTPRLAWLEWSPDSSQIAFQIWERDVPRIYLTNVSSINQATPLVDGLYPNWSPDSDSIVFVEPDEAIRTIDIDTGDISTLVDTPADYRSAIWSPDGRKIAFVISTRIRHHIYVMDVDDSDVTEVGSLQTPFSPRIYWAPDSSKLAFTIPNRLFVVDIDGTDPIEFSADSMLGLYWHPTADRLSSLVVEGNYLSSPKRIETYELNTVN